MLAVSLVRCKTESLKKLYFKSISKCFKRVKIDKWQDSPHSFPPIDYCVRIKWLPWRPFIQWWYSVIDFLIVIASISKLLHSWLFIDPSEHHYTTQTSKFNNFLNRSSTMLNNVFKKSKPVRCDLIPSSKVLTNAVVTPLRKAASYEPRYSHFRDLGWYTWQTRGKDGTYVAVRGRYGVYVTPSAT